MLKASTTRACCLGALFGLAALLGTGCSRSNSPSTPAAGGIAGDVKKESASQQAKGESEGRAQSSAAPPTSADFAATEDLGAAMKRINTSNPQSLQDLETFIFDFSLLVRDSTHAEDPQVLVKGLKKHTQTLRRISTARDDVIKQLSALSPPSGADRTEILTARSHLIKANRGLSRMCRGLSQMNGDDNSIRQSIEEYQAGFKQYRTARDETPNYWEADTRTPVLNSGTHPVLRGSEIVRQGLVPDDLERQSKAIVTRSQELRDEADRITTAVAREKANGTLDKTKAARYLKRLQEIQRELIQLSH